MDKIARKSKPKLFLERKCKRLLFISESKREVERGAQGSRLVEKPIRTGAGELSENVAFAFEKKFLL